MKDVCVTLDKKRILNRVSITLKKQELVMLLGLNGSGKTTLMRTLIGATIPDVGEVKFGEKDALQLRERERSHYVSYVPQTMNTSINYTVEEYVLLGITPSIGFFQTPGKEEYEKALHVIKEFGLYDKRNQKLFSLSGGERQLTSLARARLQDTPWMVLDEPLANLDYVRQHQFIHRLLQYQASYKQGIFMSVHDPNIALNYADTVIVLHNQTVQNVIHRSEEMFEEQLMSVLNGLYENHLKLLKVEEKSLYYWKE